MDNIAKPALAEFIGTFALVFIGGAAVASGQPVVVPALAHGLILAALIYAYGHISETHINPAVTAGLLIGGKITFARAIAYWVAQFAGGIVAALVLQIILGTNNVGPTVGSLTESNVWAAAAFEFILVFFLVSTIYQTAIYGKGGNMAAFAIGVTLAAAILAGGTYTGASLNPARTLGPAIVAGDLSYVLPYFIGMFGGGLFAGVLHTYVLGPIKE
ncbi:MAG: aquaporin [Chloroflexota bacterium]